MFLVSWLATLVCFPFAPFPLLFPPKDLSFSVTFYGLVLTFVGKGLADSFVDFFLGSSIAALSAELNLLGTVAV